MAGAVLWGRALNGFAKQDSAHLVSKRMRVWGRRPQRGPGAEPLALSSRGTAGSPGGNLARLPVGLELRAISVGEGIRAGLAAALPLLLAIYLHRPSLEFAALGALLTCIVDPAGPLGRRLVVMLGFVAAGAMLLAMFSVLRGIALWLVLPFAALVLFGGMLMRIWGQHWVAPGNMLAVMMLLAIDAPLRPREASLIGLTFGLGGLWAMLLALVLWRIHPYGPARRANAEVWDRLASATRELKRLAEAQLASAAGGPAVDLQDWDVHARARRSAIRASIERARAVTGETLRARGPSSGAGALALIRLEAADQLFGLLVALADIVERGGTPQHRAAMRLLRRLEPLLRLVGRLVRQRRAPPTVRLLEHVERLVASSSGDPVLDRAAARIAERLRIPLTPAPGEPEPGTVAPSRAPGWRQRFALPLAANLDWNSAVLRHAARVTVLVCPALLWTQLAGTHYTHWLTITLVLVLQPYFAATSQRAVERIGGTLVGGLVAGSLAWITHTPLQVALMLPLLCTLALAMRQVSYGLFIAFYTPVVVLLVESGRPGESEWVIATMRMVFTVAGGLMALAGSVLLWPSWEPGRLGAELRTTLLAHASYAGIALRLPIGQVDEAATGRARRAAGLASNNLEASLSRAMQEPGARRSASTDAVLTADAILRRVAGRLAALAVERAEPPDQAESTDWLAWAAWVEASLAAMADRRSPPERDPRCRPDPALDRIARQVDLLAGLGERIAALPAWSGNAARPAARRAAAP